MIKAADGTSDPSDPAYKAYVHSETIKAAAGTSDPNDPAYKAAICDMLEKHHDVSALRYLL